MTIRHTTATVLLSALLLASGSGLAAAQTSLEGHLSETAGALQNQNSGAVGREEKLTAEQNLQIARDLAREGKTAQAWQYLNIARGAVGLNTGAGGTELAGSLEAAYSAKPRTVQDGPWLSFSRDFHNPHSGQ